MIARDRGRTRDERGFSVMEVLLAVAITALIITPLLMWVVAATRNQVTTRDVSVARSAEQALRTAFQSDFAAATGVVVLPPPATPGLCGAAAGTVLVSMTTPEGRDPAGTIAYLVGAADTSWGTGGREIRRARCEGATVVSNARLAGPVWPPAGGWARSARCVDSACREAELSFAGPRSSQAIVLTATRRPGVET